MKSRLEKVREALAAQDLDAIIVTQPENRRYVSGFTGSDALILISAEHALLATDSRYYEQVARQAPHFRLVKMETSKTGSLLNEMVHDIEATRVGFESHHVTVAAHEEWSNAAEGFELLPTRGII